MKAASPKIFAVLAGAILMVAAVSLTPAQTASKTKDIPAPVRARQIQDTASATQIHIRARPIEMSAMEKAVETNDTKMAKSILIRNGFTQEQLVDAFIKLQDDTTGGHGGPAQSKVKVSISGSCCPVTVTITISF